jgi:dTDP-4-dehydrorhamnose 3,5-epimerase-like enzyme
MPEQPTVNILPRFESGQAADSNPWRGLRAGARERLETRDYSAGDLATRLATTGACAGEVIANRGDLREAWIPGVEMFARRIFQQKGRGYFGELVRLDEEPLGRIGLRPQQWASALMHRDSAKGIHIHPPHVPEGMEPGRWFQKLYLGDEENYELRPYGIEQWDVMFFLTGICEMLLIDERAGLPRRVMRFVISGDSRPGPDNAAVVIPAGVAHALRSLGTEDLIMVYGTSTTFHPDWEGRIASEVENAPLPPQWEDYLRQDVP